MEFAGVLHKAISDLLTRNGLRTHQQFARVHLGRLVQRSVLGLPVSPLDERSFENFECGGFLRANWFYWPHGNYLPSRSEFAKLAKEAREAGPSEAPLKCTSSLEPHFVKHETLVKSSDFRGEWTPVAPTINVTPTNEVKTETMPVFRSFAEGGS